jgi:hypothetical protein
MKNYLITNQRIKNIMKSRERTINKSRIRTISRISVKFNLLYLLGLFSADFVIIIDISCDDYLI